MSLLRWVTPAYCLFLLPHLEPRHAKALEGVQSSVITCLCVPRVMLVYRELGTGMKLGILQALPVNCFTVIFLQVHFMRQGALELALILMVYMSMAL